MINEIEKLIAKGFHVFPLQPNGKKPHIANFTENAATDLESAKKMWVDPVLDIVQPYNIGIATSKFNNGLALLVVDVDTKKDGHGTLNQLELNGKEFPQTWQQQTASGGLHLIYKVKEPVKQGANVLGKGIDIRSRGGYIVGAGSTIDGSVYSLKNGVPLADAPDWIIEECNKTAVDKRVKSENKNYKTDSKASIKRVTDYLKRAKPAIEGEAGDERTYKVISRVKDLGVSEEKALDLLVEYWNPRCQPPWNPAELKDKIDNAFIYGQNDPGVDSPEADFEAAIDPTEDPNIMGPVQKLNQEYSYVIIGGRTTIVKRGETGEVIYMNLSTFHDYLKAETIYVERRWRQMSEVWMESKNRSSYESAQFLPEQTAPDKVYNLWQGFSCDPLPDGEEPTADMVTGVTMFKEHALKNVCDGDKELFHWLMGYFAQMIQRPWDKPTTALVFKGIKGVGKNALIDRIGMMFEPHYTVVSNKRYLTSNFNSHMAGLLLFVLDEAFWSGDKSAEGILKDLITGNNHTIEQKGKDSYKSKNLTRTVIIGNEDWLVPSSVDERRFAVFNVGDDRREDTKFFSDMKEFIDERGGNRLLMRELMAFDLSTVNLNRAPATAGLLEQKIESLPPMYQWWLQSLEDGQVADLEFDDGGWPKSVTRNKLRDAFQSYTRQRGIRQWLPSAFGKQLRKACSGLKDKRAGDGTNRFWAFDIPPLDVARKQFEEYIRHDIEWPDFEDEVDPFS